MSELIAVALISGGFVALSTVANLFFNYRLDRARLRARDSELRIERADWYRRTLFERRLEAVQRAHGWVLDLYRALNFLPDGAEPDSPEATEVWRIATDARSWYDENVLYLFGELVPGSSFVGFMNTAQLRARGQERLDVWQKHQEADDEIKACAAELLASLESGD